MSFEPGMIGKLLGVMPSQPSNWTRIAPSVAIAVMSLRVGMVLVRLEVVLGIIDTDPPDAIDQDDPGAAPRCETRPLWTMFSVARHVLDSEPAGWLLWHALASGHLYYV
jgi:hypothetical protein